MGFAHAMFDLVAHPEAIGTLRDELESVTRTQGWSKTALGNMYKLDSFLKESHRFHGLGASEYCASSICTD